MHYCGASVLAFCLQYLARYRRKVVRENLKIAFGEKTKKYRKRVEQRFYLHFSDFIVETLKALTISREEILRRLVIKNPVLINDFIDSGTSVFVCGAHFGNWEWFITLPIYARGQIQTFFQSQNSPTFDKFMLALRSRIETHRCVAVESHKAYRHIIDCKKKGIVSTTLVIADQSPHYQEKGCWLDFLGHETAFHRGFAKIAKEAEIALVYPSVTHYERGKYEITLRLIADNQEVKRLSVEQIVARYAAYLEDDIRHYPHLWLWSHRRWKLSNSNG